MKKYDYILFDLDGTLTESARGVRLSIEHTMKKLELPCPDLSDYTLYIGPPLEDTFRGMCDIPEELIPSAMQIYRDFYDAVGIENNGVYDGVFELLDSLREMGCKTAVCTSKNEPVAVRVCDVFDLSRRVDAICGSTPDGSMKAKADLIPYAMRTLGCTDKSRAVMIGDTYFDSDGAKAAGVDFIGVTYGYGTVEAMEKSGASDFADSPSGILKFIDK